MIELQLRQILIGAFLVLGSPICLAKKSSENPELKVAGTAARLELEVKLAFELDQGNSFTPKKLGQLFFTTLQKMIDASVFDFPKISRNNYYLDPSFQSFVFKDIYLDDAVKSLLQQNSAYRLRYRWVNEEKYFRYRLFPFVGFFYPDRCEIQFKFGYKRVGGMNRLAVEESRFEFRNDSTPFDRLRDAPAPPWPQKQYLQIAKSGKYEQYRMLPYDQLANKIDGFNRQSFSTAFELVTRRYRLHLNGKNPWGTGPNPDHVFIITMDRSSSTGTSKKLLEFEIEMDRNTSTRMHQLANHKSGTDIETEAKLYSVKALDALEADLSKLQEALAKTLSEELALQPLPLKNKYRRFTEWLAAHQM